MTADRRSQGEVSRPYSVFRRGILGQFKIAHAHENTLSHRHDPVFSAQRRETFVGESAHFDTGLELSATWVRSRTLYST
jgi:hypothetical protein